MLTCYVGEIIKEVFLFLGASLEGGNFRLTFITPVTERNRLVHELRGVYVHKNET